MASSKILVHCYKITFVESQQNHKAPTWHEGTDQSMNHIMSELTEGEPRWQSQPRLSTPKKSPKFHDCSYAYSFSCAACIRTKSLARWLLQCPGVKSFASIAPKISFIDQNKGWSAQINFLTLDSFEIHKRLVFRLPQNSNIWGWSHKTPRSLPSWSRPISSFSPCLWLAQTNETLSTSIRYSQKAFQRLFQTTADKVFPLVFMSNLHLYRNKRVSFWDEVFAVFRATPFGWICHRKNLMMTLMSKADAHKVDMHIQSTINLPPWVHRKNDTCCIKTGTKNPR